MESKGVDDVCTETPGCQKKKIQIATSHSQYIQTSARADSSLGSCCIRECECVCALLKTHTVPPLLLRQTQPEFCGRNHKTSLVTTYGFFFFDLGHVIAKLDTEKIRHFLIWYSTAPPRVWCYHCAKYLSYSVWRQKSSYVAPAEQNFSDGRSSSCQRTVNSSAVLQWHNDKQLCPRTCSKIHHTYSGILKLSINVTRCSGTVCLPFIWTEIREKTCSYFMWFKNEKEV